jgi:organic hydroperoxide reductase OsmC/OhrA
MSEAHGFVVGVSWPAGDSDKAHPDPGYTRSATLSSPGHPPVAASAPEVFGGRGDGYNPEELLALALSHCHMLTYLAVASRRGLAVRRYEDRANATLAKGPSGKMQVTEVVLHPRVTVARGSSLEDARAFHERAHAACFVANSVNFPVTNIPEIVEE